MNIFLFFFEIFKSEFLFFVCYILKERNEEESKENIDGCDI